MCIKSSERMDPAACFPNEPHAIPLCLIRDGLIKRILLINIYRPTSIKKKKKKTFKDCLSFIPAALCILALCMYICSSISRAQSEYTKWRKMRRYMLLNEPSSLRGKEHTGVTLLTGCGINLWLQPHVSSPVHIEEMPSVQKWDEGTAYSVFHTHADIDILAQSLSCWHRQAFARFGRVRECCLNSLLSYWLGRSAVLEFGWPQIHCFCY